MIRIYDLNLSLVAILENAFDIGYEKRINELWTASFSLPATDEKNAECQPFRFVEVFDGDDRVDLFRILPTSTERSNSGPTITYQCEHVLATLLDDVMFQYHQIGGTGVFTNEVIEYILSQQSTLRWQLGTVDFSHQFQYKWENENLLSSLFSVPKPFIDAYVWTWDTTTFPWTLNLIQAPTEVVSYIRYRKNLQGVTKEEDPTELCTRLYVLGYGEGVNQLGIASVNPTGQPYIDADTQGQYGVISRVWVDRRYENEETLFAAGQAILNELKVPYLSYSVDAADLYRITKDDIDKFKLGYLVRVQDEELGIDTESRVVGLSKSNVEGNPGDIQIQIANKTRDIAGSIADLADRTRINQLYAQGATNLDSHDFADNADPSSPAVIRFYLPEETVRINKMLLNYETGAFRAYSKATLGGGAIATSTSAGGGAIKTSGGGTWYTDSGYTSGLRATDIFGEHDHGGTVPPDGDHGHVITLNHNHDVDLPDHAHDIELPDHTHEIEYGIFSGPSPSAVTVKVDGNEIPGLGTSESDVDIIPYLSKDGEGRIQRGVWHEITITPDDLGRVVADVVTQLFVQSRGGGSY